jgi:hypothetical protein
MPGIIPAATIVSSVSDVFTTSAPHNLVVGLQATVSNHTGGANGTYIVSDVPTSTTFLLDDPVTGTEVVSNGTGGTVIAELIAWENMYFPTAANRVPYQKINLLPATPENPTMGDGFYREVGIFQITLVYPLQLGTGDAFTRAELIRQTFPRGSSFSNGGVTVNIIKTPEIRPAMIDDEAYQLPVRVSYYADIFN